MKTHTILKSFDALPSDLGDWRVDPDRLEVEQTHGKLTEGVEAQQESPPEEFAPLQPDWRWGINE